MKKKRMLIYISSNIQNHEFIYTGITFNEFIEYLQNSIKNILLLKADFIGNNYLNKFELVEGEGYINLLKKEDIYNYGDFCFVDYTQSDGVNHLTDEQIAELLFMAHMHKPLKTPFFEVLNNRFAYLAHDDGFVCKLYCRELNDFLSVINGKIVSLTKGIIKKDINSLDVDVQKDLLQFAEEGLLLDFDESEVNNGEVSINVYSVGKHTDMDKIINECKELKGNALNQKCLQYKIGKWHLA